MDGWEVPWYTCSGFVEVYASTDGFICLGRPRNLVVYVQNWDWAAEASKRVRRPSGGGPCQHAPALFSFSFSLPYFARICLSFLGE